MVHPSQKIPKTHLPHMTIKAFPISISITSLWFTLLSFTLQHIWLTSLTQFGSYIELSNSVHHLITQSLSKLHWYEHHLLIIPIYNYIYEIESRPSLSFLIMHKVLSSHHIFSKSNFIVKIAGTCIDCIFRNQSMFIKNHSMLISISTKQ